MMEQGGQTAVHRRQAGGGSLQLRTDEHVFLQQQHAGTGCRVCRVRGIVAAGAGAARSKRKPAIHRSKNTKQTI